MLAAEPALTVDYVAVADLDGPTLAAAVRVGATRLIDNVRLDDAARPRARHAATALIGVETGSHARYSSCSLDGRRR